MATTATSTINETTTAPAVPARTAVERFVPRLRDTAQKIRTRFTEQQAGPPPHLSDSRSAEIG